LRSQKERYIYTFPFYICKKKFTKSIQKPNIHILFLILFSDKFNILYFVLKRRIMRRRNKIPIVLVITAILVVALLGVYFLTKDKSNNKLGEKPETSTTSTASTNQNNTATTNNQTSTNKNTAETPKRLKVDHARAVYLSGDSAGITKTIDHIIELSKTTNLNAVVIDVKESGKVNYESSVEAVKSINAIDKKYNPEEVIKKLHENNIYVIGRVVCFRDNYLGQKRPDLAVKRVNGQAFTDDNRLRWILPFSEEAQNYNIDIAKEAADKGFDEIQFDYVRFPDATSKQVSYGQIPPKADVISEFLKKASDELHKKEVLVSADVFAIICESQSDGEAIGQIIERVGKDIDYVSPMIYPSHFANASKTGAMHNGMGQEINGIKFTAPDLEPYKVVYNTMLRTMSKISTMPDYKAKIRPYLQAFTASYLPAGYKQKYGPAQVKEQIKAANDGGSNGWILWDPANIYRTDYFEAK
jgi:hypothetical protein